MGGLNLTLRPEVARDDIVALEPHQRLEVVRALRALRDCHTDPKGFVVETLGPSRAMLKLDGCLSLKVNCGAAYDSALRIVVLMTEDSLEVLAVGRRQGSEGLPGRAPPASPEATTPASSPAARLERLEQALGGAETIPSRRLGQGH